MRRRWHKDLDQVLGCALDCHKRRLSLIELDTNIHFRLKLQARRYGPVEVVKVEGWRRKLTSDWLFSHECSKRSHYLPHERKKVMLDKLLALTADVRGPEGLNSEQKEAVSSIKCAREL